MNRTGPGLLLALGALITAFCVVDASHAQQPAGVRRIGVIAISTCAQSEQAEAFRQGLQDAGYAEGRDISIDWWCGQGSYGQVEEAVANVVKQKVDVIVLEGAAAALAAKRATATIPIVMALVGDPVGIGVIRSLSHPGGNITGLTNQTVDVVTKRLQLLHEALPKATRVLVPFNPDTPYSARYVAALKTGADRMGIKLTFASVRRVEELRRALSDLSRSRTDALMPADDAFMSSLGDLILELATKARIPVVYPDKPLARRGVLLSYAVDHSHLFRRAASYVDKILKGAAPAALPVEQPTDQIVSRREPSRCLDNAGRIAAASWSNIARSRKK